MYAVYMHPVRQFELHQRYLRLKNSHGFPLQGLYCIVLCYHPQHAPFLGTLFGHPLVPINMVLHNNELTHGKVHMHHELQDVKMNQ